MPEIPAICSNCGLVFRSGIAVENSINITFTGCTSKCPRCGGIGRVPDGTYNVLGGVVEILARSTTSLAEIERIKNAIEVAQKRLLSREELGKQISETVPELEAWASTLPTNRNELYAFLQVVIALLTLLIAGYSAFKPSGPTEADIDSMVNAALAKVTQSATLESTRRLPPNRKRKFGRNEPCHCGSGKKYKKCCLPSEG